MFFSLKEQLMNTELFPNQQLRAFCSLSERQVAKAQTLKSFICQGSIALRYSLCTEKALLPSPLGVCLL